MTLSVLAPAEPLAELDAGSARALTDEVKRDAEQLWSKLLRLYEGGAHTALGYPSWGKYFEVEFGGSSRHGYRLLDAGRVLESVTHGSLAAAPNERQARELAPLLREDEQAVVEVWRDLRDEYGAENVTAKKIRGLVRNRMRRADREQLLAAKQAEEKTRVLALSARYEASDRCRIDVQDIRSWRPSEPVDAIVTDPPYITLDAVALHSAVADLAVDSLRPGGALVVMTWQPLLAAVLDAMRRPELEYRWTLSWLFDLTNQNTANHQYGFFDRWKPVLVFYKPPAAKPYVDDIVRSGGHEKALHPWQQELDGFEKLVRFFSEPGGLVCDPFAGSGTTAVACHNLGRRFVGCDVDPDAVAVARGRLAA